MSRKTVWKDTMILDAYRLARQGMTEVQIAKALGISTPTLRGWETKKKVFRYALTEGRKEYNGTGKQALTIQNHIFNRLSPKVRKTWNKLNRMQKEKQGFKKIEAMLEAQGKYVRQSLFVYAWTSSNFKIVSALRKVNIPRVTFDKWRKTDKGFASIVLEIENYKKDFWENGLYQLGAAGSESAILFANKTINSDRFVDPKKVIDINVSGNINVSTICLLDLDLSKKQRILLLKSIRKYKKELNSAEDKNQE